MDTVISVSISPEAMTSLSISAVVGHRKIAVLEVNATALVKILALNRRQLGEMADSMPMHLHNLKTDRDSGQQRCGVDKCKCKHYR